MNRLTEFLEEPQGGFPTGNLALLMWPIGMSVTWMVGSIQRGVGRLHLLNGSITTVTRILMGCKVVQCSVEGEPTQIMQQTAGTSPFPCIPPKLSRH